MEWESKLYTVLSLALMLKDLASLIHGAISLDSAKLRATLIMLLAEGMAITHISSLLVCLNFYFYKINSIFKLSPHMFYCMYLIYRLFKVNGEPVFIRGANWILSDGLLRLSKKRYNTDIKFHADMNFNMIRCWGGGLTERPEFYHYCDYYGLLVSFSFFIFHYYMLVFFSFSFIFNEFIILMLLCCMYIWFARNLIHYKDLCMNCNFCINLSHLIIMIESRLMLFILLFNIIC